MTNARVTSFFSPASRASRSLAPLAAAALGAAMLAAPATAQVGFNGAYTQNFNTLGTNATANAWTQNSTLPGWWVILGTSTNLGNYRGSTGSDDTGAVYSFGSALSKDRALGSITNGTGAWRHVLVLQNNTGAMLSSVFVQYTGEQWRTGAVSGGIQVLGFDWSVLPAGAVTAVTLGAATYTAEHALDFSSRVAAAAGPLDGNADSNRTAKSSVISGLAWASGDLLVLRWTDSNEASNSHGLAIDNVAVFNNNQLATSDTNSTSATVNGAIATDEYGPGNQWRWTGDGASFGQPLGNGAISLKSDSANLYVAYTLGATLNDSVVVLLDTGSVDPTSYPGNAGNNGDENAITRMLGNSTTLPASFRASYAIVFGGANQGSGNRFYTITTGAAVSNPTFSGAGTGNALGDVREVGIPFTSLGFPAGPSAKTIRFVASLGNPSQSGGASYLSSESIPPSAALNGFIQPGQTLGTFSQAAQFTTLGCPAVTIGTQPSPTSQTVCAGSSITYNASGSGGSGSFTYLWKQSTDNFASNNVDASGINTSPSYSPSTTLSGNRYYRCIVSSTCGTPSSATSNTAALTVNALPGIPTSPAASPSSYCTGSVPAAITLSAATNGGTTIRWYSGACGGLSSTLLGSGTSFDLLGASRPTSAGTYTYYARGYDGTCDSASCAQVTVTVNAATSIGTPPTAQSACIGGNAMFSVSATGTGLSYHWKKGATTLMDGGSISGASSSQLTITGVIAGDADSYSVDVLSTTCSTVTTTPVALSVNSPPNAGLAVAAESPSICGGTSTNIQVAASESGVSYQLRNNVGDINVSLPVTSMGGTINLSTGELADTTTFNVFASVAGCSSAQLAQMVTVTVNPGPSAPTGTISYSAITGSSLTISASVGSGETVDWYTGAPPCGGSLIASDQPSLTIASVAAGSTPYFAKARNISTTCTSTSCLTVTVTGSSPVVISQVYGGGGNSGATFHNDFVELLNRGATIADISGYTLQYASTTGSFPNILFTFPSGTTIAPGGYLLVQASGGADGVVLPPTTLLWGQDMGATGGKVALASNSTTVTSPTDANVVDFVGYGAATTFEGSGPTPATSVTASVFRNNNGCSDTNQNAADFTSHSPPRPRNSSSPRCNCAGGLTDIISDASTTAAIADGALGSGEYGPSNSYQFGGDGNSFGGMLGYYTPAPSTARIFMKSGDTGLTIAVRAGAAVTGANTIAILLDTKPGGSTSSPNFLDNGDAGRSAASRALRAGRPPTFGADYVLIVYSTGATLFSFDGSSLTPVSIGTVAGSISTSNAIIEIPIPFSAIGSGSSSNIDFIASISNGNLSNYPSSYNMSDETTPVSPALTGAGLQGSSGSTFTNYNRFITACATPVASLTVSATTSPICSGDATTITVDSTEGDVSYQLRTGSTPIGAPQTGNGATRSFDTEAVSSTTTFNIYATRTSCGASVQLAATPTVSVTQSPLTDRATGAAPPTVCPDSTTTIVVAGTEADVSYQLMLGSTPIGSPQMGTGGPNLNFMSSQITSSPTIFTIAATRPPCATVVLSQPIPVTLKPIAIPPAGATASPAAYCSGSPPMGGVTLTAIGGSGTQVLWTRIGCNVLFVRHGNPIVLTGAEIPTSTTRYFASWESECNTSECAFVDFVVNESTTTTNPAPQTVCSGQPASFSVTAGGTGPFQYQWKHEGNNVGPDSPTLSISAAAGSDAGGYTCTVMGTCGTATSNSAALSVTPLPTPPTSAFASAIEFCRSGPTNPGEVTLTAGGGLGEWVQWYDGTSGPGGCGTAPIGFRRNPVTIIVPSSAGTYTFYARNETSSCGNSTCVPVTIIIHQTTTPPTSATANGASTFSYCGATTPSGVVLHAEGGSGSTLKWYSGACGGTFVGMGNDFSVFPTEDIVYNARWEDDFCAASSCVSVAVTVTDPTNITIEPPSTANTCAGASASFGLTATGDTLTYLWEQSINSGGSWNPADGTRNLATYTTSSIAADGTLFRCQVSGACGADTSTTVTLTVVPNPLFTATIELEGVDAGTFDRCISFDFYGPLPCTAPIYSTELPVSFTSGRGTAIISTVPCGTYSGISVRDRLHTLRRTGTSTPAFDATDPNNLIATFTAATDKALRGGNVNDDAFIDILDFGGYIGRVGQSPGASTSCSTAPIHADFSGDNLVDTGDFTFIQSSFLAAREPNPCGNSFSDEQPIIDISIPDLVARGEWDAARGDLNLDGRLNAADVAFLTANGLPTCSADINHIGGLTVQDIFDFVRIWMDGHPAADTNRDHTVSVQDIFDYLSTWFAGC